MTQQRLNKAHLRYLAVGLFALLLLSALTWAHYRTFTSGGRYTYRDYMSVWSISRAVIERVNPYDPAVWESLRATYGGTWHPAPSAPYPLWTGVLFLPFALLSVDVAAALWLALSEILFGISLYLLIVQHQQQELPGWALGGLLIGGLITRWWGTSLNNGQMTLILLFIVAMFLFMLKKQRPFWAGLILSLVAVKPNPFIILLPMLGIWLLIKRRWPVIAGGAAGGAILVAVSWLIQPGWISGWLWVRAKGARAPLNMPTVWGFSALVGGDFWWLVGLALTVVLVAGVMIFIVRHRHLRDEDALSLIIIVSIFLTPYAWVYEQTLLLIPLIFIYTRFERRWLGLLTWIMLGPVLSWFLYWIVTLQGLDRISSLAPLVIGAVYVTMLSIESPDRPPAVGPAAA